MLPAFFPHLRLGSASLVARSHLYWGDDPVT